MPRTHSAQDQTAVGMSAGSHAPDALLTPGQPPALATDIARRSAALSEIFAAQLRVAPKRSKTVPNWLDERPNSVGGAGGRCARAAAAGRLRTSCAVVITGMCPSLAIRSKRTCSESVSPVDARLMRTAPFRMDFPPGTPIAAHRATGSAVSAQLIPAISPNRCWRAWSRRAPGTGRTLSELAA